MENITKKETMTKNDKIKAMEKESNITLVSTAVAIVSFFFLLYAQNLTKTNAIVAQKFLTAIEILYLASAVGVILFAVIKKKSWLWEYAIFGIVMALGYYLMHHGVSGIPFLIKEAKRMEKEYPDETYDQGPTLAVHELAKKLFEEG